MTESIRAVQAVPLEGARYEPTSVYRYYDRHGLLLYVGITKQGMGRNHQHNGRAEWWQYVARQEVEHLPSRASALAREKELIRAYRPPFNKQHNFEQVALRDAYLALVDAEPPDLPPQELYQLLEPGGRKGRNSRPGWRWLPLDPGGRTDQDVVFRSRIDHAGFARALRRIRPSGVPIFDAATGVQRGRVVRLERMGSFVLFHTEDTKGMPPEISNVRGAVKWSDHGPTIRRVLFGGSNEAGGQMD